MGTVGLIVKRILMPVSPTPEQITSIGQLASRWSIGSLLILFLVGAILFYFVDEEKGKREVAYLSETSL
jgi:UMF1 family MFS transporter